MNEKRLSICLCSDFFFPSVGGIETHVLELAKQLIAFGHKVVVITRNRGSYDGEVILFNTLKVYYLKRCTLGIGSSLPAFWATVPQLYPILRKEKITHVHCHQSSSSIGYDAGIIAQLMGLKVFFTEHSLLGLGVIGALHLNLLNSPFLHCCDQLIAVSQVQAHNIQARTGISDNITVIPNGVDSSVFVPLKDDSIKLHYPTIIAVTRFEKRRGSEMLKDIIHIVCTSNVDARFVIAGDGSNFEDMKSYLQESSFNSRVELLGYIPHDKIASVLQKGQFFVNCSLTDAFCIANVEAASCGLYVISTDIGGIPEVLPEQMRTLVPPCPKMVADAILDAIDKKKKVENSHQIIENMFSWQKIVEKIVFIYRSKKRKENVFRKILKSFQPYMSFVGIVYYALVLILMRLIDLIKFCIH
ncbi:phosphatidylinositol N-acetylglucosaminyltransferase subunit A [Histomonas meleagridis]|uniref:phosphatidylinositol N-acetylglucosaminyltransferase subunit A n=1 Tax=Histomonas meleagridis TaxID=135588 RepID=UPI00355AB1F7|nr:phosphatidylinositol N-acetylglucosaminyltransferase subunit A [Histomonas meleagridis]KAH0797663.1 phosphatidylinositol N-acetylglucosaminyltransferase subunit A [Histomonas meleagridis]